MFFAPSYAAGKRENNECTNCNLCKLVKKGKQFIAALMNSPLGLPTWLKLIFENDWSIGDRKSFLRGAGWYFESNLIAEKCLICYYKFYLKYDLGGYKDEKNNFFFTGYVVRYTDITNILGG